MMIGRMAIAVALACSANVLPVSAQRAGRPRAALVRDIEQIFMTEVGREMNLTPDQSTRFERVVTAWGEKRASLEADARRLRQSLNRQLTPGVAADPDSVATFVDALDDNGVAYAETFRDEMHELTPILTPVQRGQFLMSRDRLLQRIRQLQEQRVPAAARRAGAPQP